MSDAYDDAAKKLFDEIQEAIVRGSKTDAVRQLAAALRQAALHTTSICKAGEHNKCSGIVQETPAAPWYICACTCHSDIYTAFKAECERLKDGIDAWAAEAMKIKRELEAERDKWRDLFNGCSNDLGVALRQHEATKAECDRQRKAANHWMAEANHEHNENERLKAERDDLLAELQMHPLCEAGSCPHKIDLAECEAERDAAFVDRDKYLDWLIAERANNLRLQIRAEDCGSPKHNFPGGQTKVDRSINEETVARRQIQKKIDAAKEGKK